jgi:hypothetical protein
MDDQGLGNDAPPFRSQSGKYARSYFTSEDILALLDRFLPARNIIRGTNRLCPEPVVFAHTRSGTGPSPLSRGELLRSITDRFGPSKIVLIRHKKHLGVKPQKRKKVKENPAKGIKTMKEPPRRTEVLGGRRDCPILDLCSPGFRPIVAQVVFTGMRQGETLGLGRAGINLTARTINVTHTKNNERRVIPINDRLLDELRRIPPRQDTD